MSCETSSTSLTRKTTWPRPFGTIIEIISSPSLAMRASSLKARAGMMAFSGFGAGEESVAFRTDRRKPSAAAMVTLSFSICMSTPISTGRASSVEAAKATWWIISLKSTTFNWMAPSMSGTGRGGNSCASMHLISLLDAPDCTCRLWVCVSSISCTWSPGRALIRSPNVRAGAVVEPSCSMRAGIQQVIPISKLVAESRRRPSSVAINTLASTGNVLRGETARETMLNPRARFSCRTVTFMAGPLCSENFQKYITSCVRVCLFPCVPTP